MNRQAAQSCHACRPLVRQTGFTLIELMIVVAVLGTLAAIAYPSYTEYLVRSRRSAAESYLMDLAARQQEYQLNARRFATEDELGIDPPADVSDFYSVTVPVSTQTTFRLQATPTGIQLARDTKCGTLTLNQAGVKTESGTGTVETCWGGR